MPPPSQPQSNLPIFIGNVVRFANTNNFVDVYKKSLGRGAVAVFSDAELEPLTPFDIQIMIAGEPKEISTQAQVVSRRPGMYLLQLLDDAGAAKSALSELAQKIQDKLSGDLVENLIKRAHHHATTSPKARQGPLPKPGQPAVPAPKLTPAPISLGVSAPPPGVPVATDAPPPPPAVSPALQIPKGQIADVIGLDFGQSFTCAAVGVDQAVYIVHDDSGQRLFPTAIRYAEDGSVEVAWQARQHLSSDPTRTVTSLKRLLGRKHSDPLIAGFLHSAPYQTKLGTGDTIDVLIDGKRRKVPDICADIMRFVRSRVSAQLDRSADKVVLTHPVAFEQAQKEALKGAAELAGFEVVGMLDEPVAVALAYGLGKGKHERVAVYDFGGGTFDFTILEVSEDQYNVVARAGDAWLGGDDFDLALAQALGNLFWRQTKVEIQNRAVEWQRLLHACENGKRLLSDHEETEVLLEALLTSPRTIDLRQRIDRSGFQRIAAGLFGQTLGLCQDALDDAGLKPQDIDQLVVAGGTSRIPFVRQGIGNLFNKPTAFVVNPEEAVALGAALEAARLCGHTARHAVTAPSGGAA